MATFLVAVGKGATLFDDACHSDKGKTYWPIVVWTVHWSDCFELAINAVKNIFRELGFDLADDNSSQPPLIADRYKQWRSAHGN
jgi:hypothetical protein